MYGYTHSSSPSSTPQTYFTLSFANCSRWLSHSHSLVDAHSLARCRSLLRLLGLALGRSLTFSLCNCFPPLPHSLSISPSSRSFSSPPTEQRRLRLLGWRGILVPRSALVTLRFPRHASMSQLRDAHRRRPTTPSRRQLAEDEA